MFNCICLPPTNETTAAEPRQVEVAKEEVEQGADCSKQSRAAEHGVERPDALSVAADLFGFQLATVIDKADPCFAVVKVGRHALVRVGMLKL